MNAHSPGDARNPAYHLLFGSLSMDLEAHWREAALSRQRALLQALLDRDPTSIDHLRTAQRQLRAADVAARAAARQLLALPTLWQIVGVGHPAFDSLVAARGQGLLAEARMQAALGLLDSTALSRVEAWVAGTLREHDQVYQVAHSRDGRREYLQGVLVLSSSQADAPALLYWPGSSGGLQVFDAGAALREALQHGDAELLLLPLAANHFANSVRAQWQEVQARASAIQRGERWYDDAPSRQESLERLRLEAGEDFAVGLQPARTRALAQTLEEVRSGLLAEAVPSWWWQLPLVDRAAMGETLSAYVKAQRESEALLQRDLPARAQLVRRLIDGRLIEAFDAVGVWQVELDLPREVTFDKQPIAGSGAPGVPVRRLPRPSTERERLSLDQFALEGVDDAMKLRLDYLQLSVEASDDATRQALNKGIDKAWLVATVEQLDVAQAYEDALVNAFLAMPGEDTEAARKRRACIAAPWLHRLQWQASSALARGLIEEQGWQMVHCALHGQTPADWQPDGWQLTMCTATLSSGSWAGLDQDSVGLAGVMLLQERQSGVTVLYQPDAPDGRDFIQYATLDAACQGLAQMAVNSRHLDYLAGRPVEGEPTAHAGYLREAQRNNFANFIKPGPAWPATTSLAQHQANVHMGRLLRSHRSTSRSQAQSYLQEAAVQHGAVFDYVRIALGLVPFVGVAVSVHDGWNSANAAVAAFLAGRPGEGLDHIESLLLSVIDAGMDVAPGVVAGRPLRARLRARLRQQRHNVAAVQRADQPALSRFHGYESTVNLKGLAPGTLGRYRGIYRHADGDFIFQDGRTCRVQWDEGRALWRLAATSHKGYRQALALDDGGQWTTYGALHGQLVPGGAGGGAALGRMAEEGWLGLAGWLRRRLLGAETEAARASRLHAELTRHLALQDSIVTRLERARQQLAGARQSASALAELVGARQAALRFYQQLVDKSLAAVGNARASAQFAHSFGAAVDNVIVQARVMRIHLGNELSDAVERMRAQIPDVELPASQARAAQRRLYQAIEQVHQASRAALDNRQAFEAWVATLRSQRHAQPQLGRLDALLAESATALDYQTAHMGVLSTVIMDAHIGNSPASRLVMEVYMPLRKAFIRASIAYRELKSGLVVVSLNERHRLLEDILRQLRRFEANQMHLLETAAGDFHRAYWLELQGLNSELMAAIGEELATLENSLTRMSANKAASRPGKASSKRLFETVDDSLLVGRARRGDDGAQLIDIADPVSGQVIDTFSQSPSGRWQVLHGAGAATTFSAADLPGLIDGARTALDDLPGLVRRVERLAESAHVHEPRDLQHMLDSHAEQLRTYARQLQRFASQSTEALVRQLQERAEHLLGEGRRIRLSQTKRALPTGSRLSYLIEHQQAQIQRVGPRIGLRNARGRIVDYLQEYVVLDTASRQPIWYAHFHYPRAEGGFADYSRAHLKTVAQRKQGRTSQMLQEQSGQSVTPIWREQLLEPHVSLFAAAD
ncbi:hypothetical protein SFA35_09210 [Pseudomonas sp. HR96]|uniref:dermonecrotic toxin domain-containing protein n=1 Tax=Pseudomonas sp. HR96 TaxID=1027966 RepID=UPI002A7520DE|nr:DUF6543 domain-containing protein [Pseudomonas sp. HR96]WPP01508.1 hypothetical protein SFA35_09210 [Pseudomonas sp. HR96]